MRTSAIKVLRWLATVAALIFSVDALLSIYKTIVFQVGIGNGFDFFAVLLVCLALLAVSVLTGLGAIAGTLGCTFLLPVRTMLCIAIGIGLVFLVMNALPFSEWTKLALTSKSESVGVCVALCCALVWLTRNEKDASLS